MLDVFREEPAGADHPLLALPMGQHFPGVQAGKPWKAMRDLCVLNIIRVLSGQEPKTPITL